jgi:HAL2 family 3'(2'),5'-bisphosphate nucleotidase
MADAARAVRLAGALCRKMQFELRTNEKVSKSDDSPVTVADFAAQAVVSHVLGVARPDVGLVAEEDARSMREPAGAKLRARVTAVVNDALEGVVERRLSEEEVMDAIDRGATDGGASGSFWILDPIDGTKGFINGRQYAIALALMEDGEVTGGVLGCPNMPSEKIPRGATEIPTAAPGVIFVAYKGRGTTVGAFDAEHPLRDGAKITTNKVASSSEATYMESWGDSIVADHGFTNSLSAAMGVTAPPVRIDSMAKYGALARGDTNMYLRFPPASYREKVWDHAAGAIVVQEAGGVITDGAGNPLDFSKGRFLDIDIGIVATSSPELHATLLETIAKVR